MKKLNLRAFLKYCILFDIFAAISIYFKWNMVAGGFLVLAVIAFLIAAVGIIGLSFAKPAK